MDRLSLGFKIGCAIKGWRTPHQVSLQLAVLFQLVHLGLVVLLRNCVHVGGEGRLIVRYSTRIRCVQRLRPDRCIGLLYSRRDYRYRLERLYI